MNLKFDTFKTEAGLNRFIMTPSKWIEQTGGTERASSGIAPGGDKTATSALDAQCLKLIAIAHKNE